MTAETDYAPISVHVASSDVPLSGGKPRRTRRGIKTNTFTLNAGNPVQMVLPQSDSRVGAFITSAILAATAEASSSGSKGAVTSPGANVVIAATAGNLTGTYTVTVTVYIDGTVAAATDDDNMTVSGAVAFNLAVPSASPQPVTYSFTAVLNNGGISVKSIGAGTVGAVYHAVIILTPQTTQQSQAAPVIFMSGSQAGAMNQGGGATEISGADTMPFPVDTTDQVWVSAASLPATVSVLAIYEEAE